jgi:hypothetical protein
MELQICTDSTVGSFLSWGYAIEDSLEPGFAVAEDGAAGMAGSFLAGCQQPFAVSSGDQYSCVDATEGFGVGVLDQVLPGLALPGLVGI